MGDTLAVGRLLTVGAAEGAPIHALLQVRGSPFSHRHWVGRCLCGPRMMLGSGVPGVSDGIARMGTEVTGHSR